MTKYSCRYLFASGLFVLSQLISACGGDKDKEKEGACAEGTVKCGQGWVTPFTGETTEIDFKDAPVGAEFVVMPYALGDVTKIEGATAETFEVTLNDGVTAGLRFTTIADDALNLKESHYDWQALDADRRHLVRSFRPELGEAQTPGFWETVQRVDRALANLNGSQNLLGQPGPVERSYRQALQQPRRQRRSLHNLLAPSCPQAGDEIVAPSGPKSSRDVAVKEASDETDFCYVVVSTPVTEPDSAAIKASVKEVLRRFKSTNFYNDTFAPVGEFTFKPFVIIVAFDDNTVWPDAQNVGQFQGAGFYITHTTDDLGAPTLYMAADFSKVVGGPQASDSSSKPIWHATIAHEMQHAVIDYYRGRQEKRAETAALDESIAHFFEDLFGYGSERFSFPKDFFSLFPSGIQAFMSSSVSEKADRGAGQAFLYYLTSQKGGFTKDSDGYVSGGDGLKYLIEVVKNSSRSGTINLAEKFGGNWLETVGNYLGALVLDGTAVSGIEKQYKVAEPLTGVKDLNGNANKTFGMHYNLFGGLVDRFNDYEAVTATNGPKFELSFYQTKPVKVTLTKAGEKLKVKLSAEQQSAAVSVVRIK